MRDLLPSTAADRFFDYCLQPYEPRSSPIGKLRAENLLWHSLDLEGLAGSLGPTITTLQQRCGRDMTVFGIKEDGSGRLFWELYFYDPKKEDARVTATSVIEALAPTLQLGPTPSEAIPYFMFSFDLDAKIAAERKVDGLNLYLAAREVQAGRSYKLTSRSFEFENTYRFLHPKTEIDNILFGIRSSAFVDFTRNEVSKVLFPELFTCRRICIAKKRRSDAIYYSGIDVDQLLWFLRRFRYPEKVIEYTEAHRVGFSHLLFDVGIDYGADAQGRVRTGKTSFYGTF
jgi:hypothetical protein